jgi:hypothetical protein
MMIALQIDLAIIFNLLLENLKVKMSLEINGGHFNQEIPTEPSTEDSKSVWTERAFSCNDYF